MSDLVEAAEREADRKHGMPRSLIAVKPTESFPQIRLYLAQKQEFRLFRSDRVLWQVTAFVDKTAGSPSGNATSTFDHYEEARKSFDSLVMKYGLKVVDP